MANSLPRGSALPFPILIADIGGTNARFAILKDVHAAPVEFGDTKASTYETFNEAVQQQVLDHTSLMPQTAVIAVAGPIKGDRIDLTNNHWIVEPLRMLEELSLKHVVVINDFEAQALAVVSLEDKHLKRIGDGVFDGAANRVVIGPGTGLGVAGIVHAANTWIPVAGEGGHVDLGPRTPRDTEIFPHIQTIGGRVSGEQVLCGRGLVNLYCAVAKASGSDPAYETPEDITNAALSDADAVASETISLFSEYLGRVAGDLALVFMARGGVYISGGITLKMGGAFDEQRFLTGFKNKEPHNDIMAQISAAVVTHDRAPMEGLAAYAKTPSRFGVALDGRYWRS
ncbi:MAG: glucokinase [Pseudomonadota bacterium]